MTLLPVTSTSRSLQVLFRKANTTLNGTCPTVSPFFLIDLVHLSADNFFAELGSASDQDDQEVPDDGKQFDLELPPPKITKFQDAISSLEDVQSFPDYKGFSEEAMRIASSMNALT